MKINTTMKPKIRKIASYETKGAGNEPTWTDIDTLSIQEYMSKTQQAINWYYKFYSKKEGQEWLIAWYHNHFPKRRDSIKYLSAAKTESISNLLCSLYPLEQQGWKARYSILRHIVRDLDKAIASGFERRSPALGEEGVEESVIPQQTVQERVREQAGIMSEELDVAIDSFIMNPDAFDPKAFKIVNLLRNKGVKAAHARYIRGFFVRGHSELKQLSSGNADDQLREAYRHLPRKNVRKLLEFYDGIEVACEQIIGEAKVLRKPRTKKVKPLEDLVKKIKFLASDDSLGIASVSPTQLIGAQYAVVYNVKTRKLGCYTAKSASGLSVIGASLDNYSEKSIQKTLRKPAEQLKTLKDLNTQRRIDTWFTKEVTTTDTKLSGRLGEDTLIIRIFK